MLLFIDKAMSWGQVSSTLRRKEVSIDLWLQSQFQISAGHRHFKPWLQCFDEALQGQVYSSDKIKKFLESYGFHS